MRTHIRVSGLLRGQEIIDINDVTHFVADQKYIDIHHSGRVSVTSESLKEIHETLGDRAMRIHRNCLVMTNYITGTVKQNGGMFITLQGTEITPSVSRRHQAEVNRFIVSKGGA